MCVRFLWGLAIRRTPAEHGSTADGPGSCPVRVRPVSALGAAIGTILPAWCMTLASTGDVAVRRAAPPHTVLPPHAAPPEEGPERRRGTAPEAPVPPGRPAPSNICFLGETMEARKLRELIADVGLRDPLRRWMQDVHGLDSNFRSSGQRRLKPPMKICRHQATLPTLYCLPPLHGRRHIYDGSGDRDHAHPPHTTTPPKLRLRWSGHNRRR